jgi:hypothetical protein
VKNYSGSSHCRRKARRADERVAFAELAPEPGLQVRVKDESLGKWYKGRTATVHRVGRNRLSVMLPSRKAPKKASPLALERKAA